MVEDEEEDDNWITVEMMLMIGWLDVSFLEVFVSSKDEHVNENDTMEEKNGSTMMFRSFY